MPNPVFNAVDRLTAMVEGRDRLYAIVHGITVNKIVFGDANAIREIAELSRSSGVPGDRYVPQLTRLDDPIVADLRTLLNDHKRLRETLAKRP